MYYPIRTTASSIGYDPWAAPDEPDYYEEDEERTDPDDEASSWADLYNDDARLAED